MNRKTNNEYLFSVVCYKSKTLSTGEHPLMLRITKDRKLKFLSRNNIFVLNSSIVEGNKTNHEKNNFQ